MRDRRRECKLNSRVGVKELDDALYRHARTLPFQLREVQTSLNALMQRVVNQSIVASLFKALQDEYTLDITDALNGHVVYWAHCVDIERQRECNDYEGDWREQVKRGSDNFDDYARMPDKIEVEIMLKYDDPNFMLITARLEEMTHNYTWRRANEKRLRRLYTSELCSGTRYGNSVSYSKDPMAYNEASAQVDAASWEFMRHKEYTRMVEQMIRTAQKLIWARYDKYYQNEFARDHFRRGVRINSDEVYHWMSD